MQRVPREVEWFDGTEVIAGSRYHAFFDDIT